MVLCVRTHVTRFQLPLVFLLALDRLGHDVVQDLELAAEEHKIERLSDGDHHHQLEDRGADPDCTAADYRGQWRAVHVAAATGLTMSGNRMDVWLNDLMTQSMMRHASWMRVNMCTRKMGTWRRNM